MQLEIKIIYESAVFPDMCDFLQNHRFFNRISIGKQCGFRDGKDTVLPLPCLTVGESSQLTDD